eukprot:CAMPEP_0175950716 /NCGR_PEP_ID=MMETSP0108-20121206/29783_1 /TAXON_ID=195067 ORGANISM="Goniomonas pacifica, Strain CCMP1869" /NCGR_SAMPLE_ID=MMETSP0108 /ASSEMBLY_ACC=CAM_ASM_000204 /LENGTH=704 /DNA_ID=CAMNT_0017276863 /DNA_START=1 /DNA_END=2115 /DNA_ORIENTATION=+
MLTSEPTGMAGVGIYFQQDGNDAEVYVKALVKGGSAERDGNIKLGDVIVSIDGRNCVGQSLDTLRQLIRGEVGTYVDLGFQREDVYGQDNQYEVSLMRGSAEYMAWMERKELEDQLAKLQKELRDLEQEVDRLRRQLRELEQEQEAVQQEIARLRPQIEANKENLLAAQSRTKEEFDECRRLQELLAPLEEQRERYKHELDRLRRSLRQSEDQLLAAKDALDEAQRRFLETEETCKKQTQAREDCEKRMTKTEQELSRRRDDDRKSREEHERVRHQMELDVRGLRNKLSQEQHETIRESQRRDSAQQRLKNVEEERLRLDAENQRLKKMLREAETSLQQSQLAKTQVEATTTELQRAITKLSDQGKVQETHIEDLKRRLHEERDRWERSVQGVVDVRTEERERFAAREEQLTGEHNRVTDLFQQTRMAMESENSKLSGILSRLTPETAALQKGLGVERATTEQLRQEMNALAQRMERAGSELLAHRDQLSKVEAASQQVESDKGRSESRIRAIEEELQRELEKEALRATFVAELERKMEQERVELDEVVRREEDRRREVEIERLHVEEGIKPVAEKIRSLQQRDREYMARLQEFRASHAHIISRFQELLRQQHNVRSNLRGVTSPYDEAYKVPLDYANPRLAIMPPAADPAQLSRRHPAPHIAGLLPPPPPVPNYSHGTPNASLRGEPVLPRMGRYSLDRSFDR